MYFLQYTPVLSCETCHTSPSLSYSIKPESFLSNSERTSTTAGFLGVGIVEHETAAV